LGVNFTARRALRTEGVLEVLVSVPQLQKVLFVATCLQLKLLDALQQLRNNDVRRAAGRGSATSSVVCSLISVHLSIVSSPLSALELQRQDETIQHGPHRR
jgi:hypothetical protein